MAGCLSTVTLRACSGGSRWVVFVDGAEHGAPHRCKAAAWRCARIVAEHYSATLAYPGDVLGASWQPTASGKLPLAVALLMQALHDS